MTHQQNVSGPEFKEAINAYKVEMLEPAKKYLENYGKSEKSYHQRNCAILKKLLDPETTQEEKTDILACAELRNAAI